MAGVNLFEEPMAAGRVALLLRIIIVSVLGLWDLDVVKAVPQATKIFCEQFPNSPHCRSGNADCTVCHTHPPQTNDYGGCLSDEIGFGDVAASMAGALKATQGLDCDGDGISNLDEILKGTPPGVFDGSSGGDSGSPELNCEERNKLSDWDVCGYDHQHAFKRVFYDFCGVKPSFDELTKFMSLADAQKDQFLQKVAQECMLTEYWRGEDGVVWRLAHPKIQPLQTLKSGRNRGSLPLGDYDDDYHLFLYHHIDGNDIRGILTAQYHVMREGIQYTPVDEVPLHENAGGVVRVISGVFKGTQQWVPKANRAGLLTTLWTSSFRTMFTSIPRTTAAHALRAFLDLDIARSQGLVMPEDKNFKLKDYDSKGVTASDCAFCHNTLDPASYPFTEYNGLSFKLPNDGKDLNISSVFDPDDRSQDINLPGWIPQFLINAVVNRSDLLIPGLYKKKRIDIIASMNTTTEPHLDQTPTAGYLLGKPVKNLVEWAQVAANSDHFFKTVTKDYWMVMIGRDPAEFHKEEYDLLWQGLKKHRSVRDMLLQLITTEAYGAP
jgi:hypothetical protein